MQSKTSVKIEKEVAIMLSIYCKLKHLTMQDYLSALLKKELAEFEDTLKSMRKFKD